MPVHLPPSLRRPVGRILERMVGCERLVVAFSGGVDSGLVAALAHRALGERATAVTAVSQSLAGRELADARRLAAEIGIRHRTVRVAELGDRRFRANTPRRCYFCQSGRFASLLRLAERMGGAVVASGTNASDPGEDRPGLVAMAELGIYQPLLEEGIDKGGVRTLAHWLGLSVWDKPAAPCLASRIPHGIAVTAKRLRRIERAEEVLVGEGFRELRVRDRDGVASLEVGAAELPRLAEPTRRRRVVDGVRAAGFAAVRIDRRGYRGGRLSREARARGER